MISRPVRHAVAPAARPTLGRFAVSASSAPQATIWMRSDAIWQSSSALWTAAVLASLWLRNGSVWQSTVPIWR